MIRNTLCRYREALQCKNQTNFLTLKEDRLNLICSKCHAVWILANPQRYSFLRIEWRYLAIPLPTIAICHGTFFLHYPPTFYTISRIVYAKWRRPHTLRPARRCTVRKTKLLIRWKVATFISRMSKGECIRERASHYQTLTAAVSVAARQKGTLQKI